MAMLGMDADQIENIGGQLQQQADAIQQVITAINGLIQQTESAWTGQDATQFKDWWQSTHMPALNNAREAVAGLGQSARNNAQAQRQVSSS